MREDVPAPGCLRYRQEQRKQQQPAGMTPQERLHVLWKGMAHDVEDA